LAACDSWESADYDAICKRMEPAHPERRLLRAVLADAMETILNAKRARCRSTAKLRREALAWVLSESRSDPFAYERICETLGIHSDALRSRVLSALRDRTATTGSPFEVVADLVAADLDTRAV
jgi:hypothetical protein